MSAACRARDDTRPGRRTGMGEHGGIVLGWLVKVVLVVGLGGVIAFDGLSVAVAKVGVQDDAETAVMAASDAFQSQPDVQVAYNEAVATLGHEDAVIPPKSFRVWPDGTVRLRVERTAVTLVLRYFEPAEDFTTVGATYTGRSQLASAGT